MENEDLDATSRLISGSDTAPCLKHNKIVGVHDKACSDKSSPVRLDDPRVPIVWRYLILSEDVCGTCQYYEALRLCIEDDVKKGHLPADAISLTEIPTNHSR